MKLLNSKNTFSQKVTHRGGLFPFCQIVRLSNCDSSGMTFPFLSFLFYSSSTISQCTRYFNDSNYYSATLLRSNASRIYRICKKDNSTGNPPNLTLEFVTEIADLHPESALVKAEIKVQLQHGIQCGAYIYHQYEDTTVVLTDLKGVELYRVKCGGGKNSQIQISNCGKYFAVCGDSPELRAWTIIFKVCL